MRKLLIGLLFVVFLPASAQASWPIYRAGSSVSLPAGVSFPATVPGLALKVNPVQPVATDDTRWLFPVMGIYYWTTPTDTGLVLIMGDSRIGNAGMVFDLAAAAALGGGDGADVNAYYADPAGEALRLLTNPGTRGWNCGPTAGIMEQLLWQMRIPARMVQWLGMASGWAHQSIEIDLGAEGGWTLYDAHFGIVYRPGVTGLDVFHMALAGQDITPLIRRYSHEAPWQPQPWDVHETFDMAFGLWRVVNEYVPMVTADGVSANQVLARMGSPVTLISPSTMRSNYY